MFCFPYLVVEVIAGFSKVLGRLIFQYRFSGFAGIVQYFLIDVFALLDNAICIINGQFAQRSIVYRSLQVSYILLCNTFQYQSVYKISIKRFFEVIFENGEYYFTETQKNAEVTYVYAY